MSPLEEERYAHFSKRLEHSMPWIGLYIAAASSICVLAMIIDAFNGIRCKKPWFPCKYFCLNAASITLLAVAMKIPMDITTPMIVYADAAAKVSSLAFMSTAMGTFMPSLGSMNDKEIQANVIALGILVMTISVDLTICAVQLRDNSPNITDLTTLVLVILMLLLFATIVSWGIVLPASKRSLDYKHQEMQKVVLTVEEDVMRAEGYKIGRDMIGHMKKYLVMAESSDPQFVMARLSLCATSTTICLSSTCFFASMYYLSRMKYEIRNLGDSWSPYGDTTKFIFVTQFIGVVVGTIVLTLRFFVGVSFKCSTIRLMEIKKEFKIEAYYIQTLVYWRDSFTTSMARYYKCRKCLHEAKWYALTLCMGLQIFSILISKLLFFISALVISPFVAFFNSIKRFQGDQLGEAQSLDIVDELNLRSYVLLLEDETELPKSVLKNVSQEADRVIQRGRTMQPKHLLLLLSKFNNFHGVRNFDSDRINGLHSEESRNCWSLPLVTLTAIAIALPSIEAHKKKQLVCSVSEGLYFAKLIDKTLDTARQLQNIRKAADVTWPGVALYQKWQHINLKRLSLKCKKLEILTELSINAERTFKDFMEDVKDSRVENPVNWPVGIIAANSMYRISQTVLQAYHGEDVQTNDEMFELLSVMISDILAACLTNLPSIIMKRCHLTSIEKQKKRVLKAFLLIGRTEQVLKLLHQHPWPSLDYQEPTSIDDWRAHETPLVP